MTTHWIVGPGALGRLLALRLAGQVPLRLIGRRPVPSRQTLVTPEGERDTQTLVTARTAELPAEPPDVIHLTTKAYTAEPAHAMVAERLPDGVPLVLWQNGFACQPRLDPRHRGPVLCASTTEGAHVKSATCVIHAGHGHTYLGALDGRHTALATTLAQTLCTAGLAAEAVDDIRLRLWRKLAVNAAINPLVARFEIRNGQLREAPFRAMVASLIDEIAAILDAEGISPPGEKGVAGWQRLVWSVVQATADNRASMLQDVQAGRLTEHEAILTPLLDAAKRHGLAAPALWQHRQALRRRAATLANPGAAC